MGGLFVGRGSNGGLFVGKGGQQPAGSRGFFVGRSGPKSQGRVHKHMAKRRVRKGQIGVNSGLAMGLPIGVVGAVGAGAVTYALLNKTSLGASTLSSFGNISSLRSILPFKSSLKGVTTTSGVSAVPTPAIATAPIVSPVLSTPITAPVATAPFANFAPFQPMATAPVTAPITTAPITGPMTAPINPPVANVAPLKARMATPPVVNAPITAPVAPPVATVPPLKSKMAAKTPIVHDRKIPLKERALSKVTRRPVVTNYH